MVTARTVFPCSPTAARMAKAANSGRTLRPVLSGLDIGLHRGLKVGMSGVVFELLPCCDQLKNSTSARRSASGCCRTLWS
jgi:hypothetical protein